MRELEALVMRPDVLSLGQYLHEVSARGQGFMGLVLAVIGSLWLVLSGSLNLALTSMSLRLGGCLWP